MQAQRTGGGFNHSPSKKGKDETVPINFNPDGPLTSDEVQKMQEELNKLRNESRQLKQRLNKETESRKNWQEISRKKDEDLTLYKSQVAQLTKESEEEKSAHQKTLTSLNLKMERLKIVE